jgi:hypothetical protein
LEKNYPILKYKINNVKIFSFKYEIFLFPDYYKNNKMLLRSVFMILNIIPKFTEIKHNKVVLLAGCSDN